MKTWCAVPALVAVLCSSAFAGDFVDTRLSFVLADDNVLAGPGETTPNSPTAGFGASNANTQFYDNFNTKYSGFESLSNLTLYKKSPSFFEGFTAEAALSVLLLVRPAGDLLFRDNSSYVRVNFTPSGWGEREGISLTGFPVSADRFRLGYAYKISWGGSDIFTPGAQAYGVPGMRLQLTRSTWYAFVGAKTAQMLTQLSSGNREIARFYGLMGGFGIDVMPWLRIEANGGYFQKGISLSLADANIIAPINSAGGSLQIVYHKGVPVGTSIDFRLYRNDPEVFERFFAPELYPGGLSMMASVEGTWLTQTLENPDVFGKTQFQNAQAVALQFRMKYDFMRVSFLGLFRTPSYIWFNQPGFPPFKDFPTGSVLRPEMFGAIGFDYYFPALHLTPGVIGGVQLPATYQARLGGNNPPPGLVGARTVVFRDVGQPNILPTNYSAEPIVSAKVNVRWDLSDYFAAIGELYYTYDTNRTRFTDSIAGVAEPSFEKPHALGFNAILQARY